MLGSGEPEELPEFMNDLKLMASDLLEKLEAGDFAAASNIIQGINEARDKSIYKEVGKLTRGLHEAIMNFHIDAGIDEQTHSEISHISDASDRLDYVIKLTQGAADKTLDIVEQGAPVISDIHGEASKLHTDWQRLIKREMAPDEFRDLYKRVDVFLGQTVERSESLSENFNSILLAQDFQDLTGQVIKKVINLVQDVEDNLVGLVRVAGQVEQITGIIHEPVADVDDIQEQLEAQPEGPQIHAEVRDDVVSGQDEVDDLLSSLGF